MKEVDDAIFEFEKVTNSFRSDFKESTNTAINEAIQIIDEMQTDLVNEIEAIGDDDNCSFDEEVVLSNVFSKDILIEVSEISNFAKQLVISAGAIERKKMVKIKTNNRVKTIPNGEKIKGNNLLSKYVSKNII